MRRTGRHDRLPSQQTGAETGSVLAENSGDDPGFPLPDEKFSKPAAQWFEQYLAGAGQSATDDDQFRCQQGGVSSQSAGQDIYSFVPDCRGGRVARRHQLQNLMGSWNRATGRPVVALRDGGSGGDRFQAPVRPAGAGFSGSDVNVAYLAGVLVLDECSGDVHRAGDPSSDRQEEHVVGSMGGAHGSFGETAGSYVVSEAHRQASVSSHEFPERHITPPDVLGVERDTRKIIYQSRHHQPDGDGLLGAPQQFVNGPQNGIDHDDRAFTD